METTPEPSKLSLKVGIQADSENGTRERTFPSDPAEQYQLLACVWANGSQGVKYTRGASCIKLWLTMCNKHIYIPAELAICCVTLSHR